MRTSIVIMLGLALAGCEKADTKELERADEKLVEQLEQVGASQAQDATKVAMLEKKIDELQKQIAALQAQAANPAARPGLPPPRRGRQEPDPKDTYAVPIDGNPSDGPADALVTIVEGYEYACPYCEKVRPTLVELRRIYGADLRIVKKQFIVHPQTATAPALAVCAAHQQGKFAAMDALVWDKAYAVRKFDEATLEALAKEAGLDVSRYQRDVAGDCVALVHRDQQELQQVGQGATPTFFVNGRFMSGAQPVAAFQAIIDEELKQAKDRVASGTPRSAYYTRWILDRGLPRFIPPPQPTGP